jgi:uncharacterized membrane protein AbrB (regulator of aidB expression)
MVPTTRDRTDELRALEELWAAPAFGEAEVRRRRLPLVPGAVIVGCWLGLYVFALAFQPAAEAGATTALWASVVGNTMLLLLLAAAGLGALSAKAGFGLAALAGPLGIALAVNCRAAEHHLGNWWLLELGATVALTGLAVVGLAQRLRR